VRRAFGQRVRLAIARAAEDRASQIAEFAISLPLLVLFVVGIFDFSSALSLKQKLTNAAREGARVAASDPGNDLGSPPATGVPVSIADAFQVVDNYLISEKINDCGLAGTTPTQTAGTLKWTSPVLSGCSGGNELQLTVDRGYITPQVSGQSTVDVVGTRVTLVYPYNWRFGGVSGLLGGRFIPAASITTVAVAFNED
jgi:Flp pilus assembly protein TadG